MTRAKTLAGFEAGFIADADPWRTFTDTDEALKRRAILHALGPGVRGRVLELGAGNGSNSVELARRALRLDATEATAAGVGLVERALASSTHARAMRLVVPGRLPRARYDAVVIAELLYYLAPRAMAATAHDIARSMRSGGRLVLVHHRVDFHDFAQRAAGIHQRFLAETGRAWRQPTGYRTARWIVIGLTAG